MVDLDEECRKADLERAFMKYGPLKEIWLASYAPFYAFIVFRNRLDAQVSERVSQQSVEAVSPLSPCVRMPVPELSEPGSPDAE